MTQGRIIVGIGIVVSIALVLIFRSEHALLRGAMIPLGVLALLLVGYGGFILYSRPAHSAQSIALYESSPAEGVANEREKHINDKNAGKALMKYVYPSLVILSALALLFLAKVEYRGGALGCIFLFASTYLIDYGFVSRSDAFLAFLESLPS